MPDFSVRGSMALIDEDTVLSVIASATVRPAIYDIVLSSNSAPNDYSAEFSFNRFTADGTGTAVTPAKVNPATPAAVATSKQVYTAEPTLTANDIPLLIAHNQRATVRWVAVPGKEIMVPATAANGMAGVCTAVSTQFTEDMTIFFTE